MAIKTVMFSNVDKHTDHGLQLAASEAAISCAMSHDNVVATYSHAVVDVEGSAGPQVGIYKLYLIQVRISSACEPLSLFTRCSGCHLLPHWGDCLPALSNSLACCAFAGG